ncbi:MAG: DUF4258 domain-containing protein [Armatimonadota bacterium]
MWKPGWPRSTQTFFRGDAAGGAALPPRPGRSTAGGLPRAGVLHGYPSRLMLGWAAGRPIHVVAADNRKVDEIIVITVYEPDPALWEPGFKRKKP